jgi:hypothetical protein
MQGNAMYIRPKVVGSYAGGSYMHRAALLYVNSLPEMNSFLRLELLILHPPISKSD